MERLLSTPIDVHPVSPLSLAYVGDGVYELMVREHLLCQANRPSGELHRLSVAAVRAEAQAAAIERLMPHLTEREIAVYKRGRNAHTARTGSDYHSATGFEALWGYLYLDGQRDRLTELFALIQEERV